MSRKVIHRTVEVGEWDVSSRILCLHYFTPMRLTKSKTDIKNISQYSISSFIAIHNLTIPAAWHDFTMISNRGVLDITQCTSFSGQTGYCNTSKMAISDLNFGNIYGTVVAGVSRLGTFSCSAAAPCRNITIDNMDVQTIGNGTHISGYSCTAVQGTKGFTC